jgi:hypothetical protein
MQRTSNGTPVFFVSSEQVAVKTGSASLFSATFSKAQTQKTPPEKAGNN